VCASTAGTVDEYFSPYGVELTGLRFVSSQERTKV
jgi:hypothetical protein